MKFSPIVLASAMTAAVYAAAAYGLFLPLLSSAVFIIIFSVRSAFMRRADMVVLALTLGAVAGIISYSAASCSRLHKSSGFIGRYVTYQGVILSSAQESASSDSYRYVLRVKKLEHGDEILEDNENILLSTPEKLSCGDSVTVKGIIKNLPSLMNENGFDAVKYYKSQNIYTRIFSEEIEPCEPIRLLSPAILCGKFRDRIDSMIYSFYYGDSAAVLSAVLTGNSHRFSKAYSDAVSGTAFRRLFHPAYIHIMLILSFIGMFSALLPRKVRDTAVILILLLYAVLNCAQIGFVRCLITCALTIYFRRRNGSTYYPDTIAWIVILCVLTAPMIIFNAGFILSVAAGIIIRAFLPSAMELLSVRSGRLRRTAGIMLVCAVFYTPLTACYFNGICVYAFLAPFIMAPLVITALVTAPISFLLLKLAGTAPIVKALLDFTIWVMLKLPPFISTLPFSRIIIAAPSPTEMLATICLLFAAYYYLKNYRKKAGYAALSASALWLSVIITALQQTGTTEFTFVNVGQGDGSVIHTAFGATVLIDGGGGTAYSDYDPGESLFVPYLEAKGCGSIDAAFVSHFHQDHVQGIIAAVKTLKVKHVFAPALSENSDDDMKEWAAELEAAAEENGTELHYIAENTVLSFEKGLTIKIYAPDEVIRISKDSNDTSLLMKVSYGGCDVLYTGDLTSYGENEYLRLGTDIDADVLKVGHHGSASSTSREWVEAVSPVYAVISCGENNSYGHPTKQTLENLNGIRILRTDLNGNIKITADQNGIKKVSSLK